MRRFLCFSLCLGLMVSACKKKSLEDSVNKAITQAKAGAGGAGSGAGAGSGGGGDGGGGDDGATTVKKNNKEVVLKACLPLINTKLIELFGQTAWGTFYLRRNTIWVTTPANPLVVLYARKGLPLYFERGTEVGLGKDAATVTANLNKMAASEVIQNQFVKREDNAPGWRVHISYANTNVTIPESKIGEPPVAPNDSIIIYDRENVKINDKKIPQIWTGRDLQSANSRFNVGGWFECVVDETTEAVTFEYAQTELT